MSTTPRDELRRRGAPARGSSAHTRLRSTVAARMFGGAPAQVGRYSIGGRLGEGGGGSVWLGHDPNLDRHVAIKQVHGADERAQALIVREARSMAAVSHPNVVQIYEADLHEGKPFIAMELVEGQTLAEWFDRDRPWTQTVEVLIQAGRGLAAVHALKLIHRDFKPSNVMVGKDERVRVVDFGLARITADSSAPTIGATPRESPHVTRSGVVNGTPRYMAPEQLRGEAASARSDQYAFCLVVYEALCDELPPPADSAAEQPRWHRGVPRWFRRVIDRGLDHDPSRRWPSMSALVNAMEHAPRRRVGWGVGIAAALTIAAVVVPDDPPACRQGAALIAGSWNEELRSQIVAANDALDLWTVNEALERSFVRMDAFAARWADEHRTTCLAHRVEASIDKEQFQRRVECLEEQRRRFDVLVAAAGRPEGESAFGTATVLASLPDPSACVSSQPRYPSGASAELHERGRLAALDLAEAQAMHMTGQYDQAQTLAAQGLARLVSGELPALRAETLEVLGWLAMSRGETAEAERLLRDGLVEAGRAGDSRATAELWLILAHVVGELDGRPREGLAMADAAELAVRALGGDEPILQARIDGKRGVMWMRLDDRAKTRESFARARQLADRSGDVGTQALVTGNWGAALASWDDDAEARKVLEGVLRLEREAYGEQHPATADTYVKIAKCCAVVGDVDCAVDSWTNAATIYANVFGRDDDRFIEAQAEAEAASRRRAELEGPDASEAAGPDADGP